MIIIDLDISTKRGRGLSDLSELSILNNCIPPILRKGSKIRPNESIPRPPTHCIKALHKRIGRSKLNISVIIVEPVVVRPEVASNKASTKLKFAEEVANGIAHKMGNRNHNIFTTNIPNLGVIFGWSPKQATTTKTQKIAAIKPDQIKDFPPSQPVSTEVIQGINIKKEKNNPTYATISPADLTSFNSIDKTYLNFVQNTIIDPLKKI
jgi:hypothetical protein